MVRGDMTSPRAGAAYLALVSGAPVVPVSFLGTRVPGGVRRLHPAAGQPGRDDVRRARATSGRSRGRAPSTQVAEAAQVVTAAILKTIREAQQTTGMTLPGPLGPKREKKRA